jgi:hypothetical protein
MTSREFCYWLQGYFELHQGGYEGLNPEQTATVRRHLALVFKHEIDPSYPGSKDLSAIHQAPLSDVTLRC